MHWQHDEPNYVAKRAGEVTILESGPGQRRATAVEQWLRQAESAGAETWWLDCAPESGGLWAGLGDFVESLLPQMLAAEPDLVADYGYEISLVLPHYEGRLHISRPLTETTSPGERTRNYPADRVDRSLHGIIDLLSEWRQRCGSGPWAVVCDNYDRANGLVRRFFGELVRRRGQQFGLHLLVCARVGRSDDAVPDTAITGRFRPGWDEQGDILPDPSDMAKQAAALESVVKDDPYARYVDLPRLIYYWQHSPEPERALRWQVNAITIFNHRGLYLVSLDYADEVEANLDRIPVEDSSYYLAAVNGLYFCRVTLDQAEQARQLTEHALDHVERSELPHMYYMLAMLHARYLGDKDLEKAEKYLDQALNVLAEVDLPADDHHFMTVFLMNGLALVRVRQGRSADAITLCQAGLERLRRHLAPTRHLLHHSVLLYNIAQVYAQVGPYDRALEYLGQTIEMDPNYSEYYNDRGSVYYKLGRLEEAEADFRAAVRLSPPYPEVWVNLGQCYRTLDRMSEAVSAYSRALDLDPASALAWAGRADAYASLGQDELALDDYDQALHLDPAQPLVWAGRAVILYELGRLTDALTDLDRAVELAPEMGELRQNRAVAFGDLGMTREAVSDLRSYLDLCPDADDRAEVSDQIESLLVAAAS